MFSMKPKGLARVGFINLMIKEDDEDGRKIKTKIE